MEFWDIYDIDRKITGKTVERGKPLKEGEFHVVVHICIFNDQGELLIQQRQPFKKGWSGYWDVSVGGCASIGDTSTKAAQRELFEELGYLRDMSVERPFFTINFSKGFDDFYIIHDNIDITTLKLQEEEVKSVKWANFDEICRMKANDEFIPYRQSLLQMIFEMKEQRGTFLKNQNEQFQLDECF